MFNTMGIETLDLHNWVGLMIIALVLVCPRRSRFSACGLDGHCPPRHSVYLSIRRPGG